MNNEESYLVYVIGPEGEQTRHTVSRKEFPNVFEHVQFLHQHGYKKPTPHTISADQKKMCLWCRRKLLNYAESIGPSNKEPFRIISISDPPMVGTWNRHKGDYDWEKACGSWLPGQWHDEWRQCLEQRCKEF